MAKIIIKNRFNGSIIFEYEAENATMKDAVIAALKGGAYLSKADLSGADLRQANLRIANLSMADLSMADLRGADLSDADLSGADLRQANLRIANLSGADLSGADLSRAIKVPMFCKRSYGITGDKIHIGCERRTIEEWDSFFASDKVISTPRNTPEFKRIQAVYEGLKAYYKFLNQ